MAETFEQTYRRALARMPNVPALVVRDWVQDAFTRLCERRGGGWAFLRTPAFISTLASRSLTVTFTQNSTTVTSAALFLTTDAGRQIRIAGQPIYTIASVTNVNTALLDQPYAAANGAQTVTISDIYTVMPADFKRFLIIADPYNQRPIPFWFTQDQIAVGDIGRESSDSGPRYLLANSYSTATATLGQVRYEMWPSPSSARQFPYVYYKEAPRFSEATVLPGVLRTRGDLLVLGAQLEAAQWPGTRDQKNPYYDLALARQLEARWERDLQLVELADDNQYPEDLFTVDWAARYGLGLNDPTNVLRQTDATLADYI